MVTSPQRLYACEMLLLITIIAFFSLGGFPLFFEAYTGTGSVDTLEVQSSNSNTKVSKVQLQSVRGRPGNDLGIHLTCRLMHFSSSEYQNNSPL